MKNLKVSEYIKELKALKKEHGDLEVWRLSAHKLSPIQKPTLQKIGELVGRERNISCIQSWEKDRKVKQIIIRVN